MYNFYDHVNESYENEALLREITFKPNMFDGDSLAQLQENRTSNIRMSAMKENAHERYFLDSYDCYD